MLFDFVLFMDDFIISSPRWIARRLRNSAISGRFEPEHETTSVARATDHPVDPISQRGSRSRSEAGTEVRIERELRA